MSIQNVPVYNCYVIVFVAALVTACSHNNKAEHEAENKKKIPTLESRSNLLIM